MKDSVTQAEFAAVVADVLDGSIKVESYTVNGSSVWIKMVSRLYGEKAVTYLDFDDGGKITGRYAYAQTHAGSTFPRKIGDRIAECVKHVCFHRSDLS